MVQARVELGRLWDETLISAFKTNVLRRVSNENSSFKSNENINKKANKAYEPFVWIARCRDRRLKFFKLVEMPQEKLKIMKI